MSLTVTICFGWGSQCQWLYHLSPVFDKHFEYLSWYSTLSWCKPEITVLKHLLVEERRRKVSVVMSTFLFPFLHSSDWGFFREIYEHGVKFSPHRVDAASQLESLRMSWLSDCRTVLPFLTSRHSSTSSGQPKWSFCGLCDKKCSFCVSAERSCFCRKNLFLQK